MNRMDLAHQVAVTAAGARPCAFAYGRQRWTLGVAGLELISMVKPNGTAATALGRTPM
jgi:hypothetical protein